VGSFGRAAPVYGLVDVACSKCPDFTTTDAQGATSTSQCLTLPGYGWNDGAVDICAFGTYAPGHSQNPCAACGEGYNTTRNGSAGAAAIEGATGPGDCVVAAGFTPAPGGGGGLAPCPPGTYKSLLGPSSCVSCPSGTTTVGYGGAIQASDCRACAPGYGSAGIDPASPSCGLCSSGTFSPGNRAGGAPCQACPRPSGFSGKMVSRPVRARRRPARGRISGRGRGGAPLWPRVAGWAQQARGMHARTQCGTQHLKVSSCRQPRR
jgi:hypothetical protein